MSDEINFPPDDSVPPEPPPEPKPRLSDAANPAAARMFVHGRYLAEREIVSAWLADRTGKTRELCASLTLDVFTDKQARSLWRVISRPGGVNGYSWEQVAEKAYVTKEQYRLIEKLDPAGERITPNLEAVKVVFNKSKFDEAKKSLDQPSPDLKLLISTLQEVERTTGARQEQLLKEISDRVFDPSEVLDEPTSIFTLANTIICTPGNLTTLKSPAKAGKSAIVGAMIAAAHTTPHSGHDTLQIVGPNYAGHAMIHFDTEQCRYDWHRLIGMSMRRINRESPEPWFRSYTLTGLDAVSSRAFVETVMREAHARFGGIHSVIIDGTADLVIDPNNPDECFPLVTKLLALAGTYNTAIVNVVHTNPQAAGKQAEDPKARGHLGSQLERKSESNLMLEKNAATGVTIIYGLKQRKEMILRSKAAAFQWSKEKGMHTTCERPDSDNRKGKAGGRPKEYEFSTFRVVIPTEPEKAERMPHMWKKAVKDIDEIPETTFRDLITTATNEGFVIRTPDSIGFKYHMKPM